MDPGNWATDLAGGSKFGYTLLSVSMVSNLVTMLSESARRVLSPEHLFGKDQLRECHQ